MSEEDVKRRMTKQRRLILEVLKDTDRHPTANWIYDQVREEIPNISLGTVYRNLNVLKETGDIMELNYGAGYSRFDGNPENHYHFRCRVCGSVMDVDLPVRDVLNRDAEKVSGCRIEKHRIEFEGICPECSRKHEELGEES